MEQPPGVIIVSEGPARNVRQRHNVRTNAAADKTAQIVQSVQTASDKAFTTIERMFGRVGWLKSPTDMLNESPRNPSPLSAYRLTRSDMNGLEISAGVDLGNRFRSRWNDIQSQNIRNVLAGERMRKRTGEIAAIYRSREMRIAAMAKMATATDSCGTLITVISAGVVRLADTLRAVEQSLDVLDRLRELVDVSVHVRRADEEVATIARAKVKEYEAKKQAYTRDLQRERQHVHDREMAQLAERRLVYEQQYHHDLELYQSERRTKIESANQIRPVTSPPNSQPQAINSTEHSDPRHQATSLTPTNDRAISLDDANTRRHAKPTEDLRDVFIDDLIGGEDELEDFYAD